MSTKLYVNHISDDGAMAITMDIETVAYNLLSLGKWYDKESPVFTAGRYVCLLIPEDEHNIEMMFFDFKKNPENLKEILQSSEYDQSTKEKLAAHANMLVVDDTSVTDTIELVKGDAPPPIL
jgi:hypothetical protein